MNNDLVSRAALLHVVQQCKAAVSKYAHHDYMVGYVSALSGVEGQIAESPAVDAIEVVRCKDCKHYRDGACEEITYIMDGYYRDTFEVKAPDDYCSSGEKMDVEV